LAHDQGEGTLRICVVVPYDLAEEGGVKRHAFHVAEAMRRRGDQVTVVGPLRRGPAEPGFHGFGGVINIPANGAANNMAILTPPWVVRRFFRTQSFDVVHVHEPLVPLLPYYALWFSSSAALVCTFHTYTEQEPRASQVARRLLGRWIFPSFQRAIAVSEPAETYAALAWKKELTVIPNGVPTKTFAPGHRQPRFPTEGDPLRLLFVGRWQDRRKGLNPLLQAYTRLRGLGLHVTLDVVGGGAPADFEVPSGVTLHGSVPSEGALVQYYQDCDVFVSSATGQESFGIVLLEAMACGRPIVCSDIAGYRQVVDPKGARLVPPGDVDALVQAIAGLARDPGARRAMGELNRRRAEGYEWHELAEQVRALYVEAIAERHGDEVTRYRPALESVLRQSRGR
jgi:phosphatidyl-myo-inositol alpha-mannosyltransferase